MILATVDNNQVTMNLKNLEAVLDNGVPKIMMDVGFEALRLSQFEVPHDEGTLQNSGTVEEVDGDVVVGYHEKYAARLHENPQYNFQKGRKGKYLEDPIRENEQALGIKLGEDFGAEIKGALK